MEDEFIALTIDDLPDHILLAVLDGHAGQGAAQYISRHLLEFIRQTEQFQQYRSLDTSARTLDGAVDVLSAALVQAYVDIDAAYREFSQRDNSGCTAVCALITPSHILCANVGDSRCVVGTSDGKVIAMSEDHKPTLKDENARITNAGGFVLIGRVNGELAMSRAMGDYQYKQNAELGPADQMVSCFPDISVHCRSETDDLLILACDGVWDVMSNLEAVSYLQESLLDDESEATTTDKKNNKRKDDLSAFEYADALVEAAFAEGSTDNISAVVAKLSKQSRRTILAGQGEGSGEGKVDQAETSSSSQGKSSKQSNGNGGGKKRTREG